MLIGMDGRIGETLLKLPVLGEERLKTLAVHGVPI
jgi:hypothetical protein